MTFGKRLKRLRLQEGLTQKDLSKIIGVSDRVIGYYESDDRFPNDDKILKSIAEHFKVSIDFLVGVKKYESQVNYDEISFNTPEDAMKFILEQNVIMGFGGFDISKLNDDEIIEFANEILNQIKILSYKYKK